jgi:branched-chain amino acid transport system ATP-binding protein
VTSVESSAGVSLEIRDLSVRIARKEILHGISLDVPPGSIACIVGHNGAGKTTLLRALAGLLSVSSGTIHVDSVPVTRERVWTRARNGIRMVPQGSGFFPDLTVGEHFRLARTTDGPVDRDLVLTLFPRLAQRDRQLVGTMSGGERQMVALGLALSVAPRLLLLDELSTGLQPSLVHEVLAGVRRFNEERSTTVVLVEQNLAAGLDVANTVHVISQGRLVLNDDVAAVSREHILTLL